MLTVMSLNNHYSFVYLTKSLYDMFYDKHYSSSFGIVVAITLVLFQLRHESSRLMASERASG